MIHIHSEFEQDSSRNVAWIVHTIAVAQRRNTTESKVSSDNSILGNTIIVSMEAYKCYMFTFMDKVRKFSENFSLTPVLNQNI